MKRGFSLVEVLIAILVLALGLLGLGAVFPAIISEQRRAFDSISGETVAKIAEDMLRSGAVVDTTDLRGPDLGRVGPQSAGGNGLGRPVRVGAAVPYDYVWVMDQFVQLEGPIVDWSNGAPIPGVRSFADFASGTWWANSRATGSGQDAQILPVSARLHPQPYSGAEPAFVWDAVARRSPAGPVQVGVFVRRIDDRIRVPGDATLSDVLTGGNSTDTQLPLALDAPTGRLVPPTPNNANLVYPPPQALQVFVDERRLDWLVLESDPDSGGLDSSIGFVRRVGQQLLDNTGVVRTVVGLPQPGPGETLANLAPRAMVVSPPFTRAEASNGRTVNVTGTDPESVRQRASWVRQIVFTPHTPVAVRVFNLEQE